MVHDGRRVGFADDHAGLLQLQWLGQVRGAQAYCLDCAVPAKGVTARVQANWLTALATVLGLR